MSGSQGLGGGLDSSLLLMNPQLLGPVRQQMYGQALLQSAADVSPLRSPWQAAARALSGLVGGYEMGQGQQGLVAANQAMQQRRQDLLQGILGTGAPAGDGTPPPMAPQVTGTAAPSATPGGGRVASVNDPNVTGNNYGNIRPVGATKGFNVYDTPEEGIGAMAGQLAYNQKVHGLTTLRQQITRWAPASDGNNPDQYTATVAKATGLDADTPLDFTDPGVLTKVIPAMAQVEHGKPMGVGADVLTSGISRGLSGSPIVAINAGETGGQSDPSAGANPASGAYPGGLPPGISQALQMRRQGMALLMDPDPMVRAMGQSLIQQAAAYTQLGAYGPLVRTDDGRLLQTDLISRQTKQIGEPLRPEGQLINDLNTLGAKASSGQPLTPAEQTTYGTAYYSKYPITTEVRGNTTVSLQKTQPPPNLPYPWEVSGGQPPANFLNPRAAAAGAPAGPGAAPGTPPAPQTEAQITFEQTAADARMTEANKVLAEEQAAVGRGQDIYGTTQQIRNLMAQTRMGWSAQARADAVNILAGLQGNDPTVRANLEQIFNATPLSNTQALDKLFMSQTMSAVAGTLGKREPGSLVMTAMGRFPNIATQPEAADILLREQEMNQAFHQDRANALSEHIREGVAAASAPGARPSDFKGLGGFAWDKDPANSSAVYGAAGMLAATRGRADMWKRGLTAQQIDAAERLAARQYPGEITYTPPPSTPPGS